MPLWSPRTHDMCSRAQRDEGLPHFTTSNRSAAIQSFCSHDSSSSSSRRRIQSAEKFHWWVSHDSSIHWKTNVSLFVKLASGMRAWSGHLFDSYEAHCSFCTMVWCTASIEKKTVMVVVVVGNIKINQQAWRGGRTRISVEQHPRSPLDKHWCWNSDHRLACKPVRGRKRLDHT